MTEKSQGPGATQQTSTDGPKRTVTTRTLAIMAKKPVAGHSKTRLMPVMSAESAADIAEAFLLDVISQATALGHRVTEFVPVIAGAPAGSDAYFDLLAPGVRHLAQRGDGLNQRLDNVLADLLGQGFTQVIAINADSPTLPIGLLEQAFAHLDKPDVDVVFGPAEDGGYYLIGCKTHHPALVRDITMSTPTVLQDSLAIAAQEGLRVALLDQWYDVDEPTDLVRLRSDIDSGIPCGLNTVAFLQDHPELGQADPVPDTEANPTNQPDSTRRPNATTNDDAR